MGSPFRWKLIVRLPVGSFRRRAKEEGLCLLRQCLSRFRLAQIESVMVDDYGLLLQPFIPARLTDGIVDPVTQIGR